MAIKCCHLKALRARKLPDVGGRSPSGAPTAALAKATERSDLAQAALRAKGRAWALPTPSIALKRSTPRPGRSAGGVDSDTVSITGTGSSTITAGTGSENLSIAGGGSLKVNGTFNGSASIGPDSILELNGAATGGAITFLGANGTLKIDGTTMPGNVISALDVGDTIDLTGVRFDSLNGATLFESNNVLKLVANGTSYDLQLDPANDFAGGGFELAILDDPTVYDGKVAGFGGLSHANSSQFIGLPNVIYSAGVVSDTYSGTATGGVLTVTSGGTANVVAEIAFTGHYVTSNFHLEDDGFGHVKIVDPSAAEPQPSIAYGAATTLGYSESGILAGGFAVARDGAASIALLGNYIAGSFVAAAGGHAGTLVTEVPQLGQQPLLTHPPRG